MTQADGHSEATESLVSVVRGGSGVHQAARKNGAQNRVMTNAPPGTLKDTRDVGPPDTQDHQRPGLTSTNANRVPMLVSSPRMSMAEDRRPRRRPPPVVMVVMWGCRSADGPWLHRRQEAVDRHGEEDARLAQQHDES